MDISNLKSDINYDEITKIIYTKDNDFEVNPKGFGYVIFESLKKHNDKVAQIDASTGDSDTFSGILQRSIRVAIEMRNRGVQENDVICICTFNTLEAVIPLIAGFFLGAIGSALDPTLTLSDLTHLINLVNPKIIFTTYSCAKLIKTAVAKLELKSEIVIYEDYTYSNFISPKENEENFSPYVANDVQATVLILFSSGTTGLPKVIMGFASLYWVSSNILALGAIINGNAKVLVKTYDPKRTWDVIEKYKVNFIYLISTEAILMLHNKPADLVTSLDVLCIGGTSITEEYLKKLKIAMPKTKVYYQYGQTEVGAIANFLDAAIINKPLSVGTPVNGNTYKVVDLETKEILGPNQKGELLIKSDWSMNGYYKIDASDAWDNDGFIKTGDVVYYDEEFCFYIVDRVKEMFKYRGFHIVPAKLEGIIVNHPDVRSCVVVGIPHDIDGNHAMAIVVPRSRDLKPEDILKYVHEKVDDRHRLRGGVKFIDKLPMTPTGKVKRRVLRDLFINQ